MKLMIKRLIGSSKAALTLALIAGASSASADNIAALIGGDTASGDQATVALDASNAGAFAFARPASGPATATAYFNAHVFCAELSRTPTQVLLQPRYQLPAGVGPDVWKFADVYLQKLEYQGSGAQGAGTPFLSLGETRNLAAKQMRCLTSYPGSSTDLPSVSQGLFDSGFGGNVEPGEPTGPHQNVKVNAQMFAGFSGLAVSVVKVETAFDPAQPADAVWTLVDGYNSSALSASLDATWCGLGTTWIEGTTPPPNLCDDSVLALAGVVKETGPYVRHSITAPSGSTPYYVLVYRPVVGTATSGTPAQGFAALRTGGGMPGVAEESQDWFADDSVWYNY